MSAKASWSFVIWMMGIILGLALAKNDGWMLVLGSCGTLVAASAISRFVPRESSSEVRSMKTQNALLGSLVDRLKNRSNSA